MNEHDGTEDLQAPPELVEALRNVQKERVFVSPQVDEAILLAAREHLRPARRKIVSFPQWAALAASVVLAAGLFAYFNVSRKPQSFAAQDINRDGGVDILDAFALAQEIEAGKGQDHDFNRDGTVDLEDAKSLAVEVVRLNRNDLVKTSLFDTNFHELGRQLPERTAAAPVTQTLDTRDLLLFEFVSIREIRVTSSEGDHL